MSGVDRRQRLVHGWAQLALVAALCLVANHLASALFVRLDLTRDRRYTLSAEARSEMARLDRPVVARVYVTPGLAEPYAAHATAIPEKLEELAAFSGGRLVVEVRDPSDPEVAAEAGRLGLSPVTYRYRDQDSAEVKQVWLGVALVSGERQVAVDPITNLDALEYSLVRGIRAVSAADDEQRTIGVLQGDGEPDLLGAPSDNPLGQLRDALSAQYTVQNVTLGGVDGVPEDVDALLVIGPTRPLTDRELWQLDQFAMRGGGVACFLGQHLPDWDRMTSGPIHSRVDDWLRAFGVDVGSAAIVDRQRMEQMPVPVMAGRRRVLVPVSYPLLPVTSRLAPESPASQGVRRVIAPFAAPITLTDPLPQGLVATPVVWTEDTSAAIKLQGLGLEALSTPVPGEQQGPFLVAVTAEGRLPSAFAGRPIPKAADAPDAEEQRIDDTDRARLVAVSSADFVANNPILVQNLLDWLVEDPALISIRSRDTRVDPLTAPIGSKRTALAAGMVGGPAAALALLALLARARRGA